MAKGHADTSIIEAHRQRAPRLPFNFGAMSYDEQMMAHKVHDLKYAWWVAWFEHLLALEGRPTRRPM